MTKIEFSIDGGLTWRVWYRCCLEGDVDKIMARLQARYADTAYIWRKKEVVPQAEV